MYEIEEKPVPLYFSGEWIVASSERRRTVRQTVASGKWLVGTPH